VELDSLMLSISEILVKTTSQTSESRLILEVKLASSCCDAIKYLARRASVISHTNLWKATQL